MQTTRSASSDRVETIVVNTGPLIALARIGALTMIGELPYDFLCPAEVRAELDVGVALGHPGVEPPWLYVCPALRLSPLACFALDSGEAAVIQLALDRGIARVCIDEWKGRKAALAVGLKVFGVLGLLGRAKAIGLTRAVRPWIEKALQEGIRYHPALVQKVLEEAGE